MGKILIPVMLTSLVFCTYSLSASESSKKIVISYESWPPSTMLITKSNKKRGFVIDMMTDIFTEKGYKVEFVNFPYARSIIELKKGNVHILAETVEGIPRTSHLLFPKEPTFSYRHAYFVSKKSSWKYKGVDSLKNLKSIATIPGYEYAVIDNKYANYLKDKSTTNVALISGNNAVDRIFQMIAIGRIDMFCEAHIVGQYIINKKQLAGQIKSAGFVDTIVVEKPAFSPKDSRAKKLMQIWDEGKRKLVQTGNIKNYLEKYTVSITDF